MTQITASIVASQLRILADALDKSPEAVIRKPWVSFYCERKDEFLNTAALLPRPLLKSITSEGKSYARYQLDYNTDALDIRCSVPQSLTCTLIQPAQEAVYDCEPLLSALEKEIVGAQ